MRKCTALALLVSLCLTLIAAPALAQGDVAAQYQAAADALTQYQIVQGDPGGDLRPLDAITRAEVAKIMVAAAGRTEEAQQLSGAATFNDVASHWSSGYVAVAKKAGWVSGYPDGTFKPQNTVTYAETVTLLVRFVGLQGVADKPWPTSFILTAESAGIADVGLGLSQVADLPANRGSVFILAHNAFDKVPVGAKGENTYQTYLAAPTKPPAGAPVLTITPIPSPTAETTVTIKGTVTGATTLLVAGVKKVTGASGTFATPVSLKMGRNEIEVVVQNDAGAEAKQVVVIERVAGAPAMIQLPPSLLVGLGKSSPVPVLVKDAAGEAVANPTLTGEVTGGLGTFDAASRTFTAGHTIGTGLLTVRAGNVSASVTITVTGGDVARVEVSPSSAKVRSGTPQMFTARVLDANGNVVAGVTPVWTTESGKGIVDTSGNFLATATGQIKVTASAGGVSGEATVSVYGSATKLAIAPLSDLVAGGKAPQTVSVLVQDVDGNTVDDFSGAITLQITATTSAGFVGTGGNVDASTLSQTRAAIGGAASFSLMAAATPGDTVLSATGSSLSGATAILKTTDQTISGISVSADPERIAADGTSTTTVRVRLLDQSGNPYVGSNVAGWTGLFTSSDTSVAAPPGSAVTAVADNTNGAHISGTIAARNNIGTATIGVTVKKNAEDKYAGSATITTILVGEPLRIAADTVDSATARQIGGSQTMTLVFRLQDVNGNQVTRISDFTNLTLNLTASDTAYTAVFSPTSATTRLAGAIPISGVNLDATTAVVAGGKVTISVASGKAQTVTFTLSGTYRGIALQSASAAGAFTAGSAKRLSLAAVPGATGPGGGGDALVVSSGSAALSAYIRDDADLNTAANALSEGNVVTEGAYAVTLSRTAGTVTNWSGTQAVTSSSGVATVLVAGGAAVGTDTFAASFKPDGITTVNSGSAYIRQAVVGSPYKLELGTYPGPGTPAVAGVEHTVTVKVKDGQAAAETVTTDNTTAVTLSITDGTGTVKASASAVAVKGEATFRVSGLNTAGTFTATADASGLVKATRADYTVAAGAASKLLATLSATTMAAATDSTVSLTVQAADAYDNVRSEALTGVTVASSAPDIATVSGSCPGNTSTCTFTLTGTANVGATTVTVQKSGLSSATAAVTSVISGDAKTPVVLVDQGGTVGTLGSSDPALRQRIRVRLVDANGNQVTQIGRQQWVKLVVSGSGYNTGNTLVLDSALANNGQMQQWAQSVQGVATFYVNTTLAGTVDYTAYIVTGNSSNTQVATTNTGTGAATFAAGPANQVTVTAPVPSSIPGNGSSISNITAKVTDTFGNVRALSGSFRFTLSSSNHVFISGAAADNSLTVATQTGQAAIIVQARNVTSSGTVTVTATFTPSEVGVALPGGTSSTSATLTVTLP